MIKCTNCDFEFFEDWPSPSFKPMPGVHNSRFELRWCYECQDLKEIFLGEAEMQALPEMVEYEYIGSSGIRCKYMRVEKFRALLEDLETRLRWSVVARLNPMNHRKLSKMTLAIKAFDEEFNRLVKWNSTTKKYYDENDVPCRCTSCGKTNVSKKAWRNDNHHCGGRFEIPITEFVTAPRLEEIHELRYDARGVIVKRQVIPV